MNNIVKGFVKAFIIVGVIYLLFYYISYNVWLKKGFDNIDVTYKEENTTNQNEPQPSNQEYQDLYNKLNFEVLETNFGEEFTNIYFGSTSFTSEYYLYMGIISLVKDNFVTNCNFEKEIPVQEVDFKIKELFDMPIYENKSFSTKNGYLNITYDGSRGVYVVKTNKCSGFDYSKGGVKTQIYNSNTAGNHLYIYAKAYYVDNSQDSNGALTFNYHSGPKKEYPTIANNIDKLDLNKVATYKYTFVRENNKYHLSSIEEVL